MNHQNFIRRRDFLAAAGAASLAPTWAQGGYPNRPVRIIIPIQAGGIVDTTMRLLADRLSASLGQPVMIDNRPGGNYMIAVNAVASAPADGYTLFGYHLGIVATQAVMRKYDVLDSFTQIAMTGDLPNVVAVSAASPFRTLEDLIANGKSHPGQLNYPSPGTGSIEHLKSIEFERAAGFGGTHVPVKGGPDMVMSLLRGDCHYALMPTGLGAPYASKGQLRYLAIVADERDPSYPGVASLKELGLKVRPMATWMGLAARKGTSPAVVQRLFAEVNRAMQAPELRQRLLQQSIRASTMASPAEFEAFVREELRGLTATVALAGVRVD